jgi:hypothetical protein
MDSNDTISRYGTAASRWAGVGPYYAMFPLEFAKTVVNEYTNNGDHVIDPFAGRATSLFAASTENRTGVGIEINPVGWVYGKAKLETAGRDVVENRLRLIERKACNFRNATSELPEFFHFCYCQEVLEFLLAARSILDWRRRKSDWTLMALLLVDLHGKRECALSNQMRQTKSMSPQYAVKWWKERDLLPPERNPVEFMQKKISWRYSKGIYEQHSTKIYLGDSQSILPKISHKMRSNKASLLLTSPPYYGVTNYFYDQWLRLWLLGGNSEPRMLNENCKKKFSNKNKYVSLLKKIFSISNQVLKKDSVIYVRTDARQFTKEVTMKALEFAFPSKKIREVKFSKPLLNQTKLFDSKIESVGEVDIILW